VIKIHHRIPILLLAAVAGAPVLAQGPINIDKPLSQEELLKQIESITPSKGGATPSPTNNPLISSNASSDLLKPSPNKVGTPNPADPAATNGKGPTIITALEATFDQKANVAVFIGSVVVNDPEFNVVCDKLTAYLKHEDKAVPAATPAGAKTTPKAATPKAATPASTPNGAAGGAATAGPTQIGVQKKKGSGLDKAVAVTTSDRRVVITQDKVEADGSITHGIGIADRAEYFSTTGDIFLYGSPDVTQGTNRCVATDPSTVMTLNRDGHMTAKGPHKTYIVDDDRNKQSTGSTPQPQQ
jgi:hypothetical protein